jgi:hypothetical protein
VPRASASLPIAPAMRGTIIPDVEGAGDENSDRGCAQRECLLLSLGFGKHLSAMRFVLG